jgi:hypothetical protein
VCTCDEVLNPKREMEESWRQVKRNKEAMSRKRQQRPAIIIPD